MLKCHMETSPRVFAMRVKAVFWKGLVVPCFANVFFFVVAPENIPTHEAAIPERPAKSYSKGRQMILNTYDFYLSFAFRSSPVPVVQV